MDDKKTKDGELLTAGEAVSRSEDVVQSDTLIQAIIHYQRKPPLDQLECEGTHFIGPR